jgi:lysophospholipase L1-like esterase
MIKNFKWLLLVSLSFAACNNDDDATTVPEVPVTAGSADFTTYVSLGNSLCAGYSDGALFKRGQEGSYPNILAQQFALVGGGDFKIPYTGDDNFGGLLLGGTPIQSTRLAIFGIVDDTPDIRPIPTNPITEVTNHLTGPFNNMGVPGAKSFHLIAPGYGDVAGLLTLPQTANPYFVRFASSPSTSILADALAQNPTFFSLWIGNNDVLGYATSGGDDSNPITPATGTPGVGFDGTYNYLVSKLTENGAKGVVANIPYVTTIPFFTTVPVNPLTPKVLGSGNEAVGIATIQALNAQLYGPLKQALTAFGAGDRINLLSESVEAVDANPLLIKDETLTDLSAQLTLAFTPTLGPANAAFYGQVYGQARQAKTGDLILLTTKSVIGTEPTGIPAPINKYGITYPLQDKHVLIPSEIADLKTATEAYNVTIKSAADSNGLAFVDANAILSQVANGGIRFGNYHLSSSFVVGGAFSLDGVHPSARGYALIANKFMEAINAKYGSTFRPVDIGRYPIQYPATLN